MWGWYTPTLFLVHPPPLSLYRKTSGLSYHEKPPGFYRVKLPPKIGLPGTSNSRQSRPRFRIGPEVGQPGDDLALHDIPPWECRLGQRGLQQPFQVDAAARVDHQRRRGTHFSPSTDP